MRFFLRGEHHDRATFGDLKPAWYFDLPADVGLVSTPLAIDGVLYFVGDKIFQATWDGRLIALDAATGKQIWSTRTFEKDSGLYITGTPKAFKGKVLIGNGGSEVVARRAYVSAYDAETGELAWRFHIVPGNPENGFESEAMEMAAKTWTGE